LPIGWVLNAHSYWRLRPPLAPSQMVVPHYVGRETCRLRPALKHNPEWSFRGTTGIHVVRSVSAQSIKVHY
jgi:hypothetical protein